MSFLLRAIEIVPQDRKQDFYNDATNSRPPFNDFPLPKRESNTTLGFFGSPLPLATVLPFEQVVPMTSRIKRGFAQHPRFIGSRAPFDGQKLVKYS